MFLNNLLKAAGTAVIIYFVAYSVTALQTAAFGFMVYEVAILSFIVVYSNYHHLTYSGQEITFVVLLIYGPMLIVEYFGSGLFFQFGLLSVAQIVCTTLTLYLVFQIKQQDHIHPHPA